MAPLPSLAHAGGRSLRIVIAPNAFKGSLSASDAADAMAGAVRRQWPRAAVATVPIADGGDGSVDAFVAAGYARIPVITTGPTGEPLAASIAMREGQVVVELAQACGMSRLPGGRAAPMTSSSRGVGDAITAALDAGARRVVVCLGGSASTDGGAGLLAALGARLIDAQGTDVSPCGAELPRIATVDLTGLDARLADTELVVAADVTSPLLGPHGAAAVFAPQKGASPAEVDYLEAGLRTWSRVLADATGRDVASRPGAGAAGGAAAALLVLGADLRPGFAEVADAVGLAPVLTGAALCITGEGRLDEQSALGKGSLGVAALAAAHGIPVVAVCGEITLSPDDLRAAGIAAWADLVSSASVGEDPRADSAALVARATATALSAWSAG